MASVSTLRARLFPNRHGRATTPPNMNLHGFAILAVRVSHGGVLRGYHQESAEDGNGAGELATKRPVDHPGETRGTKLISTPPHLGSAMISGPQDGDARSPRRVSRSRQETDSPRAPHGQSSSLTCPARQQPSRIFSRGFRHRGTDGDSDSDNSNKSLDAAPALASPTTTRSSSGAAQSGSVATGCSRGSSGKRRRKVSTTPVWKRPAVPLSKPYVPVPRRIENCFGIR